MGLCSETFQNVLVVGGHFNQINQSINHLEAPCGCVSGLNDNSSQAVGCRVKYSSNSLELLIGKT